MNFQEYIFVHIAKTGGTFTAGKLGAVCGFRGCLLTRPTGPIDIEKTRILIDNYKSIWNGRSVWPKRIIIQGHFGYGVHRALGLQPNYVTILREPVERLAGLWATRNKIKDVYTGPPETSLSDFANGHIDNEMVRLILGEEGELFSGEITSEHVDKAVQRLQTFTFVGRMDRLSRDVNAMLTLMGFNPIIFEKELGNHSNTPGLMNIYENHLPAVRERVKYDLELWDKHWGYYDN